MEHDTKALWRRIFANTFAWLGGVSTLATFFPIPSVLRPYLFLVGGVLIVYAVFRGARGVIATKNEELRTLAVAHEVEIRNLNKRIEELGREPFDEEVKNKVKSELTKFNEPELAVLKALLQYEPWYHRQIMPSLKCSVDEQVATLSKGYGCGLLITESVTQGNTTRVCYSARPQFKEALQRYLFEVP